MEQRKNKLLRQEWRELGGHFQVCFHLKANGQLNLVGNIRSRQEIPLLCAALAKQLGQEYEVARQRRSLARAALPQGFQKQEHKGYLIKIQQIGLNLPRASQKPEHEGAKSFSAEEQASEMPGQASSPELKQSA